MILSPLRTQEAWSWREIAEEPARAEAAGNTLRISIDYNIQKCTSRRLTEGWMKAGGEVAIILDESAERRDLRYGELAGV